MLATESRNSNTSSRVPSQSPVNWKAIVEPVKPFLEAVTVHLAEQVEAFDPEIAEYARYALSNQGKHLRPALVALSGGMQEKPNHDLVRVAVIIEMVHLATLVHDDVMDEAEVRRRRPTVVANWGAHISVLLGDCLFAHALKLAAEFPTPEICRAVAAASNTVCSGEILQTNRRLNFEVSREEYFKVLSMKTAEFFGLSCDLGAHLGGGTPDERNALREYGMALGLAYQIYDDCLDVFGTESEAGKSLGTDLASGKITLPVLVVLEKADEAERNRLIEAITHWKPENFGLVMESLTRHESLLHSREVISGYLAQANAALDRIPKNDSRAALRDLATFLGQQVDSLGSSPAEALATA